ADRRADVIMTLEDVAAGVTREVGVERAVPCGECDGSGAEKGTTPVTCSTCRGYGQVERSSGFFSVRQTCPTCAGTGKVIEKHCKPCSGSGRLAEEVDISIDIPAGVHHGNQLRVVGEGDRGLQGSPNGDLYCQIRVKKHDFFERDHDDIVCEVPITFSDAALGAKVEVPTLQGRATVSVKAGTQSGTLSVLKGKGLPSLEGYGKGDQIVRLVVETPKKLKGPAKKLFQELRNLEESSSAHPERQGFLDRLYEKFTGKSDDA
ncbi:MAG: DnaJ C-terminal domain-containing protein, partial [Planctomycetota bacterium]